MPDVHYTRGRRLKRDTVKLVNLDAMKTISVRDLRQRWPRAEAMLRAEGEITITRDGKPVAKLVRLREPRSPRKRFDPKGHAAWQARTSGGRTVRWVDEFLQMDRDAG